MLTKKRGSQTGEGWRLSGRWERWLVQATHSRLTKVTEILLRTLTVLRAMGSHGRVLSRREVYLERGESDPEMPLRNPLQVL